MFVEVERSIDIHTVRNTQIGFRERDFFLWGERKKKLFSRRDQEEGFILYKK